VFASPLGGSTYNYQSIAVGGDPHVEPYAYRLVEMSKTGHLAMYLVDDLTGDPPVWDSTLSEDIDSKADWLSTPAIGDVDGDGDYEVVVTSIWNGSGADTVHVRDLLTGSAESMVIGEGWRFMRGTPDYPPAGPALSDLDGDGAHEIIIAGLTAGDLGTEEHYPRRMRVAVYDLDLGGWDVAQAEQSIPYNSRNDTPEWDDGYSVHPIGTPVVAEVDYRGQGYCPDIFVTASNGAIYAFEYCDGTISPKPGWPLLLPEVAREPVLAQFEPEDGHYSLVVQCSDGWLHVFDLPPYQEAFSEDLAWSSYGGDLGNTRGRSSLSQSQRGSPDGGGEARLPSIIRISPVPSSGQVDVQLLARANESIQLEIFDVSGRRVRLIEAKPSNTGVSNVSWDGLDQAQRRVPSGIYWCVLHSPSGSQQKRLVVLR
jgi:hypothetical protein